MTGSELMVWAPCLAFLLAVVATTAYLQGRRSDVGRVDASVWLELNKAKAVVQELKGVSKHIRQMVARHQSSVTRFRDRMASLSKETDGEGWQVLAEEAEHMLAPTMQLSTEMALAYDEIRQQTTLLTSFTDARTDPLTGLDNRRAMEESLKTMFAMRARYNTEFSVAIVDIDQFKRLNDEHGHLFGDKSLQQVANSLTKAIRDTDSVARFGGEEFVVIMPHTDLEESCLFAERFQQQSADDLPVTVSIGVTSAIPGDSSQTLLTRADAALYSAKSSGRNCVYRHTGEKIELVKKLDTHRFESNDPEALRSAELATNVS
jgi:diguanylate cyclase